MVAFMMGATGAGGGSASFVAGKTGCAEASRSCMVTSS